MTPPLQPCGTRAAYIRHRANGETPCEPCTDANRAASRASSAVTRERRRANPKPAPAATPVKPRARRDHLATAWLWGTVPTIDPTLARQAARTVTRHAPAHEVPAILTALGIEQVAA